VRDLKECGYLIAPRQERNQAGVTTNENMELRVKELFGQKVINDALESRLWLSAIVEQHRRARFLENAEDVLPRDGTILVHLWRWILFRFLNAMPIVVIAPSRDTKRQTANEHG